MRIGIIGAMKEEILPILSLFSTYKEITFGNNVFYEISYRKSIIYIAYSRIGKVHASITACSMILKFGCDKIIFSGVAGGLRNDLKVGDLFLATRLCQHDVDITAFGHPLGFIPESKVFIDSDKNLNLIAKEVAKDSNIDLKDGIVASGDEFVHSMEKREWIMHNFNAAAVEMEGASVAVVCDSFNVPFCVFRSISDTADKNADVSFDTFLESSAKISADFIKKMLDRIL